VRRVLDDPIKKFDLYWRDCQLRGACAAHRCDQPYAALDSWALHPDFRILWKVFISQCIACQSSFSMASARDLTDNNRGVAHEAALSRLTALAIYATGL
jgi:hypothetical protein